MKKTITNPMLVFYTRKKTFNTHNKSTEYAVKFSTKNGYHSADFYYSKNGHYVEYGGYGCPNSYLAYTTFVHNALKLSKAKSCRFVFQKSLIKCFVDAVNYFHHKEWEESRRNKKTLDRLL